MAEPLYPPAIQRLDEIGVPTLIVLGTKDLDHIHEIANLLDESVSGAELAVIPDVGHLLNMEAPREFNRLTLEFVDRHEN